MSDPADLGSNVRRRRLARGLTLDQLACASGVSPTMLSEVERSVKNPTVKLAYQVARALGCSLSDVLDAGEALMQNVAAYLGERPGPTALVHRDFPPDNLLVGPDPDYRPEPARGWEPRPVPTAGRLVLDELHHRVAAHYIFPAAQGPTHTALQDFAQPNAHLH